MAEPAADRDDRVGAGLDGCAAAVSTSSIVGSPGHFTKRPGSQDPRGRPPRLGNTLYDFVDDDEGPGRALGRKHVRQRRDGALAEADPDRKVVAERGDLLATVQPRSNILPRS